MIKLKNKLSLTRLPKKIGKAVRLWWWHKGVLERWHSKWARFKSRAGLWLSSIQDEFSVGIRLFLNNML